mgnify:CR=1 FL=1
MSVFLSAWEQRKLGEEFKRVNERNNGEFGKDRWISVAKMYFQDPDKVTSNNIDTRTYVMRFGDIAFEGHPNNEFKFGRFVANDIGDGVVSELFPIYRHIRDYDNNYWKYAIHLERIMGPIFAKSITSSGNSSNKLAPKDLLRQSIFLPHLDEQKEIGNFLKKMDSLITLHQRKPFIKNGGIKMITSSFTCDSLFKDYFEFWIKLYKEGAVRPVTLEKYRNNQKHIAKIIPNLKMKDFDRNAYQELLNQYALTHERQTVIDFHHQVKGAILDAVDDGLIDRDPTRKAIFKGKAPREKKQKYLNQFELHNLLEDLDLGMEITWDWLILLIAKTGLRFSEALGLTPADFDFARQTISVNKTWDYKTNTGFQPTKNRSSIRKVQMDWQLGMQFQHLIKNLNEDEPIFVNGPVCNSTPNNCLARHCRKCGIPEISIHGLRHTHASLLMFAGVSIASVSRRLGHSSITTTQKVYMHIISELENQDNDLVMRYLSSLS